MSAAISTLLALVFLSGGLGCQLAGAVFSPVDAPSMSPKFFVSFVAFTAMGIAMMVWSSRFPRPCTWSPRFDGDHAVVEFHRANEIDFHLIDIHRRKIEMLSDEEAVPRQRAFSEGGGSSCAIQLRSGGASIVITVPSGTSPESIPVVSLSGDELRYGHVGMAVDDGHTDMAVDDGQVCIWIANEGE